MERYNLKFYLKFEKLLLEVLDKISNTTESIRINEWTQTFATKLSTTPAILKAIPGSEY